MSNVVYLDDYRKKPDTKYRGAECQFIIINEVVADKNSTIDIELKCMPTPDGMWVLLI